MKDLCLESVISTFIVVFRLALYQKLQVPHGIRGYHSVVKAACAELVIQISRTIPHESIYRFPVYKFRIIGLEQFALLPKLRSRWFPSRAPLNDQVSKYPELGASEIRQLLAHLPGAKSFRRTKPKSRRVKWRWSINTNVGAMGNQTLTMSPLSHPVTKPC